MNSKALHISDVTIRLKGCDILKEVTADIAAGEFIGVLGPNGSGKTTLIRALLGLIPLHSGKIMLFGKAAGEENDQIGYMPQTMTLPQTSALSARALLKAVEEGNRWGIPWYSKATTQKIEEVLALVGATDYADTSFNRLSGGERQRILLAQALLGKPRLLLLDEPLTGLDPHHQGKLVQYINNVRNSLGTTVLFITHDINPLLGTMDRVLYMAGGSAVIGAVEDVVSSDVLSRLYQGKMEVVQVQGRLFIINTESNSAEPLCCHHV